MKIEVDDHGLDLLVKQWLEEMVEMGKGEWKESEDIEFWEEFVPLCERMLEMNFSGFLDESD